MSNIESLIKKIIEFRNRRDWKQFHNPKDVAISLVLESTELLEHFQWKNTEEIKKHIIDSKDEIGDELADIMYWVLLLSHDLEIDILKTLDNKIKKNEKKYPVEKAKGKHIKYTDL